MGQQDEEEIDHLPAGSTTGRNFGWDCREGNSVESGCTPPDYRPPVFTYANPNPGAAAVTGGVVSRDATVPDLLGRYLYTDFYLTDIRSLAFPAFTGDASTTLSAGSVAAFGTDSAGRVYVVSLGGSVQRIEGDPPALAAFGGAFDQPIYLTGEPANPGRVYVAERPGRVRLVVNGAQQPTPFLDISADVYEGGEGGLLSLAFPPDYATSGRFYVYYVENDLDIRIEEFRRSAADPNVADPATRRLVLEIEHSSQSNHYGGTLQFSQDGLLWIATGDGGGGGDPDNNGQNTRTLLGKLLRIDPRETSATTPPPPVPPPPAGPPPPPVPGAADTTPPRALLGGRRIQRMSRRRSVIVSAGCTESCRARVFGTISVPGAAASRVYRLRNRLLRLEPGRRARVLLVIPRTALRPLRAALRRRRSVTALVTLRVRDDAGNGDAAVKRFRLRR